MTTDVDGSATVLEPNAGAPAADKGAADQGSNGGASDPFSGLDTGTREWIGTKGYQGVGDLAKAAREAESLIGKSLRVPGPDAKDEDWQQFFAKAGRPETPDGYELARPEALPEEAFGKDAAAFREAAHKAGLTARQAKAMGDYFFGAAADGMKAMTEQTQADALAATTKLEQAFGGDSSSEAFKGAMHLAGRALAEMGGTELMADLKASGLVSEEGHILNAGIASAFWKVGKALYSEDGLHRGDPASGAENPFKDGPDKGNLTEQMRMIKADRGKAIRLMREAGHDPKGWHITEAA